MCQAFYATNCVVTYCNYFEQAPKMTMVLDGIAQRIEFCSSGDDGSSSDEVFDYCLSRNSSNQSSGSAYRTPRVNRQRSRSIAQSFSPIPYTALTNLRLFDSPSTPKVKLKSVCTN